METIDFYSTDTKGDPYSGYSYLTYRSRRKSIRDVAVNGKSPRINGRLAIRANDYKITTEDVRFTPFRSSTYSSKFVDGSRVYYQTLNAVVFKPDLGNWYSLASHEDPSNSALLKFYDKQKEGTMNMATLFAERQSAINMMADKATRIFNAYRNVKRGKVRKAMDNLGISKKRHRPRSKQAAGQWLELQYGWMPLIGDIYSLADLKPFSGDRIFGVASAFSQVRFKNPDGTNRCRRIVKYGADVIVSDPSKAFSNSLGLLNPALVAWELTPFSFVVDWFLPIGDHIENLTADIGISYRNAYKSELIDLEIDQPVKRIYTNRGRSWSENEGAAGVIKTFTRATLVKPPLPDLNFKNPISPMHLANAVALGRQLKKE